MNKGSRVSASGGFAFGYALFRPGRALLGVKELRQAEMVDIERELVGA